MEKTLKECILEEGIKGKTFLHRYYSNEDRDENENSFLYTVLSISFISPNMTETTKGYRIAKKGEPILDQGRLLILKKDREKSESVSLSRYSDDGLIE